MSENTTTTTTTGTTAAERVTRTLADHPDGTTIRNLATEAGVGTSTAAKALTAMETAGTATRRPSPATGKRKGADIWHPVTDDTTATADATADETPLPDDTTATADATADETPLPDDTTATADATADEAPVSVATPADEEPVADDTATSADAAATGDATVDATGAEAPAPAEPRQPDLKVLIMAGVLGDHPDGVPAWSAINKSGLAQVAGDTILAAMEVAGAARRLPPGEDGTELWVLGDADLATVDPANAPTHATCQTCGHTRRVRRPSAGGRRSGETGRTGRPTGETNGDGSVKLGKNALRNMVEAFVRDLGPGEEVTPGEVGRELDGRSSGACLNAMHALTEPGVLTMTSTAPVRFALTDNPPPPSPEVAALLARAAVIVTDTTVTDATDTDATDRRDTERAGAA